MSSTERVSHAEFLAVYDWMYAYLEVSDTAVRVYALIHSFSKHGDWARLSQAYIARRVHKSEPSIRRAVAELVAGEHIQVRKNFNAQCRGRGYNWYVAIEPKELAGEFVKDQGDKEEKTPELLGLEEEPTPSTPSTPPAPAPAPTPKPKAKKFTRPTVEQVRAYCRERHNSIDPQGFVDYYESVGWQVGRHPMKDWQACVRTWERRESQKSPPQTARTAPWERTLAPAEPAPEDWSESAGIIDKEGVEKASAYIAEYLMREYPLEAKGVRPCRRKVERMVMANSRYLSTPQLYEELADSMVNLLVEPVEPMESANLAPPKANSGVILDAEALFSQKKV